MLHEAATTERAPETLRASVRSLQSGRATAPRASRSRRLGFQLTAAAGALAVVLVLLFTVVGSSGSGTPSLPQVAALARLSATEPAPRPEPSAPTTSLTTHVQGLHFPNWGSYSGWHATGARHDQPNGRAVTTVFYRRGGHEVAYSIVARPALTDSTAQTYHVFHRGNRTYVLWTAAGHTCLVSAVGLSGQQLTSLAQTA